MKQDQNMLNHSPARKDDFYIDIVFAKSKLMEDYLWSLAQAYACLPNSSLLGSYHAFEVF